MLSGSQLLAFLPVAAVVVAVPGPSVLFAVGRALSVGRRDALETVLGNGFGLAIQGTLIAVGLGSILASVTWALTAMKLVGGAYLIWLGIDAIRHRAPRPGATAGRGVRRSLVGRSYRAGLVLGLSNPKTLVFLSAFLPQFVSPGRPALWQMLLLAWVFAAVAIAGDSVWALASARARDWFGRSPRRVEGMAAGGGAVLIGLGAYTLATGSRSG